MVLHPDAPSYVRTPAAKLVETAEKEKHEKYHAACALRGSTFVPLIVTTDGVRGAEMQTFAERIAERYVSKWVSAGDEESKQIEATARQYVNARLAFALAKGISMGNTNSGISALRLPAALYRYMIIGYIIITLLS